MQIDLTNIKNIVFDLGNVLLNLDFDASIQAFLKLGLQKDVLDRQQVYSDPVFYELEVGLIKPGEFRDRIRQLLKNMGLTDQQINEAWSAMILDVPGKRIEMLKKLRENYQVYLFSNTNQIHISKLQTEFRKQHQIEFPSLFTKVFYSFEIHERKPDLISYQKLIELAGINPSETLFIDDLEKNITAAQKAGLKTFLHNVEMEITDYFK